MLLPMCFPEDATMNLTDRTARAERLPAGKTDAIVFDDKLPGFGLRIRAGGKKTWIAQYRFGTAQRRLNIGSIEEVKAAKARQSAADIFAKVRLGQDPQAEAAPSSKKPATFSRNSASDI